MTTRESFACQGCDGGKRVLGKCENCNIFICENCCVLHQMCGLNLSDEQKNVGLSDAGANLLFNREIKCDFHDHLSCGFCTMCEVFVCPLCISQNHNGHTLGDMDVGIKLSTHKLKMFNSRLEQDIMKLFRDQSALSSLRESEKSKYVSQKQKVKRQGEIIKKAIDDRIQALLYELDGFWDILDKCIKEEESNIKSNGHALEEMSINIARMLDTNETVAVLGTLKEASQYEGPKHLHTNFQPIPEFVPGSITQCIIESIHGTLVNTNQNSPVEIDIKATENFITDLPSVDNILCCPDGSNLINSKSSNPDSGELQHIVLFNNTVKTKQKVLLDFVNMALLPSGELLVSVNQCSLKVFSNATGKLRDKYSVSPFKTTEALHVTKDNKIIVGATEHAEEYSSGEKKIVMMNSTGEQEMEYALDNNNKQLFQGTPFKVTSDNDNIYVIDKSRYKGRVVAIKRTGEVKSIYTAAKIPRHASFDPRDISITKSGHVIVCDETMLHFLNPEGQCVMYKEIESDLNIKEIPLSLDVDIRGMLLMGCHKTYKTNAKIHVFQLFGC